MSNLRVLVVGASIAGPMAAYWFAKAGSSVTVIEKFPEPRLSGQNLDIRLGGITVIQKIPGLETKVRAALAPLEGHGFVRGDGSLAAIMKDASDSKQQPFLSEFEISRGELLRILYDLTKDHKLVKYIFNEHITSIHQRDNGPVLVKFANGTSKAEYDLVVACDGAMSRTRAMSLKCNIEDNVKPTGTWAAYFSVNQDLLNGSKTRQTFSAPRGRSLIVGPDSSKSNRIFAVKDYPSENHPDLERFRLARKQGIVQLKQLVIEEFKGIGWKSDEILTAMKDSDDFYASEMCQVKIPTLHKGRVVLVGDSGYATGLTGTCTSLAIVGAHILAGEISRNQYNLPAGIKAYEERLMPVVKDLQVMTPSILRFLAPQTAWGIWIRNTVFIMVCWGSQNFMRLLLWIGLFAGVTFTKEMYVVPEYKWE